MPSLIQENVSLKAFNSFGFDVTARYFAELTSMDQIESVLGFARNNRLALLVIGGGSNLVLTDDIDALVLVNRLCEREIIAEQNGVVRVQAGAGENWHDFVRWTLEQGLSGLENLSLIPGTVGAAPMQNIGAYGVELKDVMLSLEAYDIETGEIKVFSCDQCGFGYRDSVFKNRYPGRYLVLNVLFSLQTEYQPVLHYGGIADELAAAGIETPTALQVSDLICEVRCRKLPQPEVIGNAGSFFKNPVISDAEAEQLKQRFSGLVSFSDKPGFTKLAAGWMIDQLGWKGRRQGDAGVYDKQALVLVNHGTATGSDILELAGAIQADVYSHYGVMLEIEPRSYP